MALSIDWRGNRPPASAPHHAARGRYTDEQLAELDRLFEPLPGLAGAGDNGDIDAVTQALQGWQSYQDAERRFRLENESRPVAPFVSGNKSAFRRGRRSGRDSLRIPLSANSKSAASSVSAPTGRTGLNIPL